MRAHVEPKDFRSPVSCRAAAMRSRGRALRSLGLACTLLALAASAVPATAQVVKVGSFAKSTGVAPVAQVVPHGLGQAPKALILWTDGKTSTAFSAGFLYAFGMTDGTTSYSVAATSQSGVANNNTDRARRRLATAALTIVGAAAALPGGAPLAEASLQSW